MTKLHPTRGQRSAFTLIEMTTSLAVASILLVAMGSAMVLAGKAIPSADNPAAAMLSTAGVADRIMAELRFALDITERTSRAITFTVPDRDGDGKPESIRYAWSGSPGAPLTRQLNGAAAANLVDGVQSLTFSCDSVQLADSYPGQPTEGAEVLFASHMPGTYSSSDEDLEDKKWVGQYFVPTLPSNALAWRVTRVRFKAKKSGSSLEGINVQLTNAGAGNLPTGSVLQQATLTEPNSSSFQTLEAVYPSGAANAPGAGLCLLVRKDPALLNTAKAGKVEYVKNSGGGGFLTADHDPGLLGIGASTTYTLSATHTLLYEVYGKVTTPTTRTVMRTRLAAVRLAMQTTSDPGSRVDTAVALVNKPESLDAQWAADFSENPTTADRNADGSPDWRSGTGFDTGQLSGGVWRADREIVSNPPNNFTSFTTLDVAFRDTTTTGSGAAVEMRVEATLLGHGIIEAYISKESNGSQTLTVQTRTLLLLPAVLTTVRNLPSSMVNLRLHVNPADDSVGVTVNGVVIGSFNFNRSIDLSDGFVRLFNTFLESGAEYDSVRVRVGGVAVISIPEHPAAMKTARNSAGFTLIEAMMSIIIVGVMYVAALQTLGASRVSQTTIADQRRGYELAQQLLAEVVNLPYKDPSGGTTIGIDAGETGTNRSLFDDIDDYNGWTEQPPKLKDGTTLTNLATWSRRVTVGWVDPDNLDTTRASESGMKRITISVSNGLKSVATVTALRANVD